MSTVLISNQALKNIQSLIVSVAINVCSIKSSESLETELDWPVDCKTNVCFEVELRANNGSVTVQQL